MLPVKMQVNKKLLPIKGHYFFFNAGTAPLVPYLSTYARQLGFSSATVGLIYTVLPIFGLIAKPLFGVIADRFKIQKSIFILFQIVTIVSFSAIYFIPQHAPAVTVKLDCGNGASFLKTCYQDKKLINECKVASLNGLTTSATCRMNCAMDSPKMWQTVCEHWHLPQYCYSNTDNIQYSAYINNFTMGRNDCAYLSTTNVSLDGYMYSPHCRIGGDFVDFDEPCTLNCTNAKLRAVVDYQKANMTCIKNNLNYRVCTDDARSLSELTLETYNDECKASCELDKSTPWRLMEICEGWDADVASSCQPKLKTGEEFPSNLSFLAVVPLSSMITEHECVYMRMKHIEMPDGSIHYSSCDTKPMYQLKAEPFQSLCDISCDHVVLNEILLEGTQSHIDSSNEYTSEFWLFFALMIISWVGQAVVVTFADAICFNLLGVKVSQYGKQRLWGSVGWGVFSLLTGTLIDVFSEGAYKDYTVAFVLMFVFMTGDVIVSSFLKIESTKMSINILADVGTLLSSIPTFIFLMWTIAVGISTGLLWQFLFWLLEDVSSNSCDGLRYIKTLQGLVSAIQTFFGEIPFLFVSGFILKKVGHVNMMSLVLFAFGVRFVLYSLLTNPWWVLPIEILQGITFGMFYPTMTSYATIVSPQGTETTVQGLVGAVFEGVGTSLGSFIGGRLYETYGGLKTFRWFGYGSLVCCAIHVIAQYLLKDKIAQLKKQQGYISVIRYQQPSDMVYMMEDLN